MKLDDTSAKCAVMNDKVFCITKMGFYYVGRIPTDGSNSVEVEDKINVIEKSKQQQQFSEEKAEQDEG